MDEKIEIKKEEKKEEKIEEKQEEKKEEKKEEKQEVKKEEKREEKKENPLETLAKKIKNKVVVLFGEPMVGKSILALHLSKHYSKPILILIDRNYPTEYFMINRNLTVSLVDSFTKLIYVMNKLHEQDYDFVIIDSVTSLSSRVIEKSPSFVEGEFSPRVFAILRYLYDTITRKAAELKIKGKTVLIIAHSSYNILRQQTTVSMNKLSLRNVDVIMHYVINENGERELKIIEREYSPHFKPPKIKFE